jgi:hypothetical protein
MRLLAIAIVALALGAAAPASTWREYVYADHGFAIQFPAAPKIEKTTYMAPFAGNLPATLYSVEHEHILYKMLVVDLPAGTADGANYLGEAAYFLLREGDHVFTDIPRVDLAARGIFGIGMVVDAEDGRRIRSSIYVTKGRLYRADAIVLPARGDKDQSVPARFDQTLRFDLTRRF